MADKKISELTNITGANLADGDELVVVDTSASETKAITFGEFKNALDTATGFVSITGDTMTGDLTVPNVIVSGNVDGRDVSSDGTKLDTVETNADVTDTANVTAAGALMDSELTSEASVKALDQGVATTDSPTFAGLTTTADVSFGDNDKAIFGAGSDLQIYHDGSNSYIEDAGTGNLKLLGNQLRLKNSPETANYLQANNGADVTIYYNGDQKLATTSTGVDITGGVTTDAYSYLNGLRISGADQSNTIYQPTGNMAITTQAGSLTMFAEANPIIFGISSTEKMRIDSSGRVGIGTSSPDTKLHLEADTPVFRLTNPQTTSSLGLSMGKIEWETRDSSAVGVIGYIDVVDSNNFGTTFDMAFATGQSGSATERMRIDSSGNVGIGTSSIAYTSTDRSVVHIEGLAGALLALEDTGAASYLFQSGNDLLVENDTTTGSLVFGTNASTERMRIDSSGRLLVGKTSDDNTVTGLVMNGSGFTKIVRSSATANVNSVLQLNRLASDGDIIDFRKDGTTVGSIGTAGGDLLIHSSASSHVGLRLGEGYVLPTNNSGATSDAAADLGLSVNRFKDLYLSGGVYLGGTGSANHLDDYETGEFTATISCGSGTIALDVGQRKCAYTKIGKLVHIQGSLGIGAISSPSGEFRIVGAPFVMDTSLGDQAEISAASVALYEMASNITGLLNAEISMDAGVATILIRDNGGQTTSVQNIANKFDSDSIVRFSVQYMTT